MKRQIKKADSVKVISGSDAGSTGEVLAVLGDYVVVQGCRLLTFNRKGVRGESGQRVVREGRIHRSNVALV